MVSFPFPPPPPAEEASARSASRPGLARLAALAVLLSLITGFVGGVIATQVNDADSSAVASITQVTAAPVVSSEESTETTSVAQVAQRLANSVVTISALVNDGMGEGEATGTGVVVTSNGEILTNAHVVDGASEVRVRFAGDTEPVDATVLASDVGNDLALLKVNANDLVAATFAKPGSVRVGDEVVSS